MTKHVVVSVYDTQLAAYGRPFFTPTEGTAVRAFHDDAQSAESPINKHPEDFALFKLGTFDDETGRFTNIEAPAQIANGKQTTRG